MNSVSTQATSSIDTLNWSRMSGRARITTDESARTSPTARPRATIAVRRSIQRARYLIATLSRMLTLVTGSTGYLGCELVRELRQQDRPVRALARTTESAQRLAGTGAEIVLGDVTDPESLPAALEGVQRVFHMAGVVGHRRRDEPRLTAVNVTGSANLLEAAQKAGVERVVYTSSVGAMGPASQARTSPAARRTSCSTATTAAATSATPGRRREARSTRWRGRRRARRGGRQPRIRDRARATSTASRHGRSRSTCAARCG